MNATSNTFTGQQLEHNFFSLSIFILFFRFVSILRTMLGWFIVGPFGERLCTVKVYNFSEAVACCTSTNTSFRIEKLIKTKRKTFNFVIWENNTDER